MRAVVQRVTAARVTVGDRLVGAIGHGLLVYIGIARDDDETDMSYLVNKIVGLRVFQDGDGRGNRSVRDVGGGVLLVSQFTLYGDCRKGHRPSFGRAAPPDDAKAVYESVTAALRGHGVEVQTGEFRAQMAVESVNDGPVTILIDSGKSF